jgi:PAS domain S-box-containing protein
MDEIFRGLLDSAPDAIVAVDDQGIIVLVNSQLERMFGYERSEIIGQPIEKLVPERFHNRHSKHRDKYTHEPRVRPMGIGLELFGRRRDSSEFSVEISLSPLRSREKNLVTASIRDVTERKQTEEKIRELNQDLEQRASQLEAANRELEAFSFSVSHDLRAPLRTIDGFSLALLEDFGEQLPDEGRNYLMRIRTAAQRMAQLIDDLLSLSRLTRAPLNPESTNLSKIAQQVLQNLQRESPDRMVIFSIEPNMTAECDPRLIKVVFENLLSNAWKFTSKQEMAQIEFGGMDDPQNGRVYFVRDNGAGFDMAYVNKLFGAFQRLHTNSEFPGIGIGLAIVQRIINRHGGRVWAEGTVNGGAAFYFTLL